MTGKNNQIQTGTTQLPGNAFPTGFMFNFVNTSSTTNIALSPGGAWTTISAFDTSITPTSASNLVLCRAKISYLVNNNTIITMFRFLRGATVIGVGVTAGSRTSCATAYQQATTSTAASTSCMLEFLDSPATTSSTTYHIQVFTLGANVFINQDSPGSVSAIPACTSNFCLCEVKG